LTGKRAIKPGRWGIRFLVKNYELLMIPVLIWMRKGIRFLKPITPDRVSNPVRGGVGY